MRPSRVVSAVALFVAVSALGAGVSGKQRAAAIRSIRAGAFGSGITFKQSFSQSIGLSDVVPCPSRGNTPKLPDPAQDYAHGVSFCFDVPEAKMGGKDGRVTCNFAFYRASDSAKEKENLQRAGAALKNAWNHRKDLTKAGKPAETYIAPKTCYLRGNCYFITPGRMYGENAAYLSGVSDPVVDSTIDCDEDLYKGVQPGGGGAEGGARKGG